MKTVFSIIIILLIKISLLSQPTMDDFTDYDYKVSGHVTSIFEESFLLNSDKSIAKKKWDSNWKNDKNIYFDQSYNVTKIEYLNPTGKVLRSDEFNYENGKITFRRLKYSTEIYFYENELLDEVYSEVSQPKIIKTGFEKPTPNSYQSKLKHIYENDKLISIIEYDSNGEKECQAKLKYDMSTDQLLEVENTCDDVTEKYEYKYLGDKIIQIKWSDNVDGLIEQSDYQYDKGEIIEESWKLFDEGEYSGKVVTKYSNFNEIEIAESDENNEIDYMIKFEYEYDVQGNWIKKFVLKDNENYLVTREITY